MASITTIHQQVPAGPPGEANRLGRIVFTLCALIMMGGLVGMLATRLYILRPQHLRRLTFQRILTILIYFNGIFFIFASALFISGWDFRQYHICRGSIELCLAFYIASKILVYLFLLDRACSVRALRRLRDPYWLAGIAIIVIGFGTIAVFALVGPIVMVSKSATQDCSIGLPLKALVPLLVYDVLVNVAITAHYLCVANRICHRMTWRNVFRLLLQALPFRDPGPLPSIGDLYEVFMARATLACFAVVLATVGNLVALIALHGHEEAWLCLTVCGADVSWTIIVVHWLTSDVFRGSAAPTLTTNPRSRQAGEYYEMH